MGKKGRRQNDAFEDDFALDSDGELKALKEPAEVPAGAPSSPASAQGLCSCANWVPR